MLGTQAKCPNIVKSNLGQDMICGCTNYYTIEKKVFDSQDGFDSLAQRIVCKECGYIYLIFPTINYKEDK